MSLRNPKVLGVWGEEGTRVLASDSMWAQPLLWNREAEKAGVRARVFSYSLGDVFERPARPENLMVCEVARARLFELIEQTPWLDWLLLTKRPENIMGMIPEPWRAGLPSNVWTGTSVENQAAADERILWLIEVPAKVRFLSMEPLLGPVTLTDIDIMKQGPAEQMHPHDPVVRLDALRGHIKGPDDMVETIHWVIVGGESGGGARPFELAWARRLHTQCNDAGVPFFMKQTGSAPAGLPRPKHPKGGDPSEWPADLRVQEFPR